MSGQPLPTLKCVIAWSDRRHLCEIAGDLLRSLVPGGEVRTLGDDAHIVHTALSANELRDRLRDHLGADDGLIVIKFEVWSGYGRGLDAKWLLARGH